MAQAMPGDIRPGDEGPAASGTIDLGMVTRIVRAETLTFSAVLIGCMLLAVLYLHVAKPRYAVRMEITSAQSSEQSKQGGGLSALSSITGFSLGGEGSPQFKLFLGSLRSPIAAEAIVSDQDLLKAVFFREWSESEGKWHPPSSIVRPVLQVLGWNFGVWSPPGVNRVYDFLNEELKVVPDNKSGVVTLEIDSNRPEVAARVLMALNKAMDDRLRAHDLAHSSAFIDYLARRLSEVNVVEYRTALIANIAQEEKTRMQASSPLPYAVDILGKPMTSTKPVSPKPVAAWAIAVLLGSGLGFALASMRYRRR